MTSAPEPSGHRQKPIGQGVAITATIACLCVVAAGANRSRSLSAGVLRAGARPSLVMVAGTGALLATAGLIGVVYAFWPHQLRRRHRDDGCIVEPEAPAAPWWANLLTAVALALIVAMAVVVVMEFRTDGAPPRSRSTGPATTIGVRDRPDRPQQRPADARRATGAPSAIGWAVAIGVTAALGGSVVALRRGHHRRRLGHIRAADPAATAPIDDPRGVLMAEPDCRRAVIGAYGAMERGLASAGVGRATSEGPFEYRRRLRASLGRQAEPAGTLTDLFVRAKFSDQPVDVAMKRAAIDALDEARAMLDGHR